MFGRDKSEPDATAPGTTPSSSRPGPDGPRPPAKAPGSDRGPSSTPSDPRPTPASDAKPSVAPRDTPATTRPADPARDPESGDTGSDQKADQAGDTTGGPARRAPGMTEKNKVRRTRVSGLWVALVIAAILAVFLLIFIAQNSEDVTIKFLGWEGQAPLAVAMLAGAVVAVLIVAVPGSLRIVQLRRALRKNVKNASA